MGPRPDDAHLAAEHVPKLRHFINAQLAKPLPKRINARVSLARLSRKLAIARVHRPEFVDLELAILHSSAVLHVNERAGGLKTLRDKNNDRQHRKNNEHDRKSDREIDRPFQKAVERIFERFFAQSDETKTAIFKMRNRMAQPFLKVAQDEKTNAELIANLDHVQIFFRKKRELEQDYLVDAVVANDLFELFLSAKHRHIHILNFFVVRNQTDRAKTDLRFPVQPFAQLGGALA